MARNKVTVIGAGNVGATTAQRIAEAGLADVVLVDIVEGLPQGKGLDLAEAAPVVGHDARIIGTNDYAATAGSDVIVVTSGLARQPGMSRDDLLAKNAGIVRAVVEASAAQSPDAVLIVVTNPLDAMCHVAMRGLGLPARARARAWPACSTRRGSGRSSPRSSASRSRTRSAFVLGGHGDTMVPLPRYSTVAGIPITELLPPDRIAALVDRTANGGAEIVALLKTGSAFYAPAASTFEMVDAILRDRRRVLPCATLLQGEYGVDGLFVGVPGRPRRRRAAARSSRSSSPPTSGPRSRSPRPPSGSSSTSFPPDGPGRRPPTTLPPCRSPRITLTFDPVLRLSDTASVRYETIGLAVVLLFGLILAARIGSLTPAVGPYVPAPGLRVDDLVFIVVGAVPGAIIGGRIGYVLDHLDYYRANPAAIVDPAQGGLTLTLAVPLGILTGGLIARLLGAPVARWMHAARVPAPVRARGRQARRGPRRDRPGRADRPDLVDGVRRPRAVGLARARTCRRTPRRCTRRSRSALRSSRSCSCRASAPSPDVTARRCSSPSGSGRWRGSAVAFTWRDPAVVGSLRMEQVLLLGVLAVAIVGFVARARAPLAAPIEQRIDAEARLA